MKMIFLALVLAFLGVVTCQLPANCVQGSEEESLCWVCKNTFYSSEDRTQCLQCKTIGCKKCQDGDGEVCFECQTGFFRHPVLVAGNLKCKRCSTPGCAYCGEHSTEEDGEFCYDCGDNIPEDGYGNCP